MKYGASRVYKRSLVKPEMRRKKEQDHEPLNLNHISLDEPRLATSSRSLSHSLPGGTLSRKCSSKTSSSSSLSKSRSYGPRKLCFRPSDPSFTFSFSFGIHLGRLAKLVPERVVRSAVVDCWFEELAMLALVAALFRRERPLWSTGAVGGMDNPWDGG